MRTLAPAVQHRIGVRVTQPGSLSPLLPCSTSGAVCMSADHYVLAGRPHDDVIWIFGFGSLISHPRAQRPYQTCRITPYKSYSDFHQLKSLHSRTQILPTLRGWRVTSKAGGEYFTR